MEPPLLCDLVRASIFQAQSCRAQVLVAHGGLQTVHGDAVVHFRQICNLRARRRRRLSLYAMLNRIKRSLTYKLEGAI